MKKKKSLAKKTRALISSIIQKVPLFKKKLNLLDFVVIFLIAIALIFLVYNRLQRKSTWIDIRVSVENVDWWYSGSPPNYWYAKDLKIGDVVKDSLGKDVVKVVDIENYDNGGPCRTIYLDLSVKVDFDKNKNQYLYEFKPLVVGSSLLLNFPTEQVRGLVVGINEKEKNYVYKTIKVELKNKKNKEEDNSEIIPALAENIKVGDKSYDTEGRLVAEVLDVKQMAASYYEFSDIRGRNIKVYDPDLRDLELTLKVKAFEGVDRYFYVNDAVLKVGAIIWIQFPNYELENARIIEVD